MQEEVTSRGGGRFTGERASVEWAWVAGSNVAQATPGISATNLGEFQTGNRQAWPRGVNFAEDLPRLPRCLRGHAGCPVPGMRFGRPGLAGCDRGIPPATAWTPPPDVVSRQAVEGAAIGFKVSCTLRNSSRGLNGLRITFETRSSSLTTKGSSSRPRAVKR
jgi:hypothetical protein